MRLIPYFVGSKKVIPMLANTISWRSSLLTNDRYTVGDGVDSWICEESVNTNTSNVLTLTRSSAEVIPADLLESINCLQLVNTDTNKLSGRVSVGSIATKDKATLGGYEIRMHFAPIDFYRDPPDNPGDGSVTEFNVFKVIDSSNGFGTVRVACTVLEAEIWFYVEALDLAGTPRRSSSFVLQTGYHYDVRLTVVGDVLTLNVNNEEAILTMPTTYQDSGVTRIDLFDMEEYAFNLLYNVQFYSFRAGPLNYDWGWE